MSGGGSYYVDCNLSYTGRSNLLFFISSWSTLYGEKLLISLSKMLSGL